MENPLDTTKVTRVQSQYNPVMEGSTTTPAAPHTTKALTEALSKVLNSGSKLMARIAKRDAKKHKELKKKAEDLGKYQVRFNTPEDEAKLQKYFLNLEKTSDIEKFAKDFDYLESSFKSLDIVFSGLEEHYKNKRITKESYNMLSDLAIDYDRARLVAPLLSVEDGKKDVLEEETRTGEISSGALEILREHYRGDVIMSNTRSPQILALKAEIQEEDVSNMEGVMSNVEYDPEDLNPVDFQKAYVKSDWYKWAKNNLGEEGYSSDGADEIMKLTQQRVLKKQAVAHLKLTGVYGAGADFGENTTVMIDAFDYGNHALGGTVVEVLREAREEYREMQKTPRIGDLKLNIPIEYEGAFGEKTPDETYNSVYLAKGVRSQTSKNFRNMYLKAYKYKLYVEAGVFDVKLSGTKEDVRKAIAELNNMKRKVDERLLELQKDKKSEE